MRKKNNEKIKTVCGLNRAAEAQFVIDYDIKSKAIKLGYI